MTSDGIGAPSLVRAGLSLLALIALALLVFASPSQARTVVDGFGTTGTLGGQFATPRGIDINQTGNGGVTPGTIYVVDSQARVQRFSPTGQFDRTWGWNVFGRDELQQVKFINTNSGSFTLEFQGQTTAPLTVKTFTGSPDTIEKPTTAEVQSALIALSNIGAGNVTVTGGGFNNVAAGTTFNIRFTGVLGGTDVAQIVPDGSGLSGSPPEISATTVENGVGGTTSTFEICTVATSCQAGAVAPTTANGGLFSGNVQGVAVNQTTGDVYVSDTGNRRIQRFDANGNFISAWGWDVTVGGITGFEICTVFTSCKAAAAAGVGGGQFGANQGYPIIDASGNVWAPDPNNRRINKYSATGAFLATYGYDVLVAGGSGALEECTSTVAGACRAGIAGSAAGQFSGTNPTKITFDSGANLFAIDGGNSRTLKFNPTLTSATTLNPLILVAYTTTAPHQILATQTGTRLLLAINNNVSASERQIVEIDLASEEITDTSLLGSGITTNLEGLAENTTSGVVYATTAAPVSSRKVILLSNTPPPDPGKTLNPIVTKAASTATFSGTVDPKGGLVSCKFQYSTDQISWIDVPEPDCSSLTQGGGFQAISQEATGLVPASHYFVRLAVSRTLVAGTTKFTGTQEFDTDPAPPAVSNIGAIQIQDKSVRLVGTINPRNSDTEYVFNYGTTEAFGSSTDPVVIGDSNTPVVLSQVVEGLVPGTKYFFNLVATNPAGVAESEIKSFTTRTVPFPMPDDRRWEQVSLPDKNLSDADLSNIRVFGLQDGPVRLAPDGEGVLYEAFGNFGEPPGQTLFVGNPYVARRNDRGWVGGTAIPPFCAVDVNSTVPFSNAFANAIVDENIEHAMVQIPEIDSCAVEPLSPLAPTPASNLYRETITSDPFGLTDFRLLAPEAFNIKRFNERTAFFRGGSSDFSHIVYWSEGKQSPEGPAPEANRTRLFDWHEGVISLVSRAPVTNAVLEQDTDIATTFGYNFAAGDAGNHAVSDDGNRIYFIYDPNPPQFGTSAQTRLYLREDNAVTYDVTKTECTVGCSEAAPTFEAASPDGSTAVFRTAAKLTDEDQQTGTDLYRYEQSADPENPANLNLTLISKDSEPADGATTGTVQGYYGMGDDGETIFFVANNQLEAGEPIAPGPKLYRWQWNNGSPSVDYLATLGSNFEHESPHWGAETNQQVTPSGEALVVETMISLDKVADQDTDFDVYRWHAEEVWTCVSCQLPGAASNGMSQPAAQAAGLQISDDGKRVPFTTADALVPADTNGDAGCPKITTFTLYQGLGRCQDTYLWNDGQVSLISDGLGTTPSLLYGISHSGRDVLFSTRQQLVGWDRDENSDLYDARIGGGFPEPPVEPAACEGEACREGGTTSPPASGAGTAVFEGPGNSRAIVCPKRFRKTTVNGREVCKKKRTKRRKHHRKQHHRRPGHDRRAAR